MFPSTFVKTLVFKGIFALTMSQTVRILPLIGLSIFPHKFAFSIEFSQLPLSLVKWGVRIYYLSYSITLVVVKAASIHFSISKSVSSLSKLLTIHNISFIGVSIFIKLFSFSMRQTFFKCSFIHISSVWILISPISLGVKIWDIANVKTSFFEDIYPLSRHIIYHFALEELTIREVDCHFPINLFTRFESLASYPISFFVLFIYLYRPHTFCLLRRMQTFAVSIFTSNTKSI